MTMAWNIERLRETGNSADATLADMLELRLEARGDFDLPTASSTTESAIDTPTEDTLEQPVEHEKTTIQLPAGLIVLADSRERTTAELMETAQSDIEKTPELNTHIQEILTPLLRAAALKMPALPTESDKERLKFGRTKLRPKGKASWDYEERRGNELVKYKSTVEYIPQTTGNKLYKLSTTLGNGEEITVDLFNNEGRVKQIVLEAADNNAWRSIGMRKHLKPLLTSFDPGIDKVQWDTDILGGLLPDLSDKAYYRHLIDLADHEISYISYGSRSGDPRIERTYDPGSDSFKTHNHWGGKTLFGQDIAKSRVVELIQAIASLVPARELGQ